jgi:pimeloyl-ACP methyl ester carboxylesterase
MPHVEVPGARPNIADSGRTDAPTLLFVHGNVMNLHMRDALVDTLKSQFRCVRWDVQLHGTTSHIMTVPGEHYLGHLPRGGHHRECGSHSRIDQHQQA